MFQSLLTERKLFLIFQVTFLLLSFVVFGDGNKKKTLFHYSTSSRQSSTANPYTKTICMHLENTLRARHKSCFLLPDIGPCRADIVQWYFDVKQGKCYRFFWGGCQGNGNRFETKKECYDYCMLNNTYSSNELPNFCSLTFDYGTCFGYLNRWTWDANTKTCKNRIYSGCGGNRNNFETKTECQTTCSNIPDNNAVDKVYTTCVPYVLVERA